SNAELYANDLHHSPGHDQHTWGTSASVVNFAGLAFDSRMLSFHAAGEYMSSEREPWKASNRQQLDLSHVGRWRAALTDDKVRAVSLACADGISDFDYPPGPQPRRVQYCYPPNFHAVGRHEDRLKALARPGNAVRLTHTPERCRERLLILLPSRPWSQVGHTATLLRLGARRALAGRRTRFVVTWRRQRTQV
ncbi:hypothetical protein, partial [uncultured Jatrophihabitans sp.]|uniref:hypothetical protein n=1 Tax=uncultured Jatrophihabitans sp. TaxID=1610747 RepID=UPI0035CB668F